MKGFYISVDEMHMLSVYKSRPITTFWDEILDFMSFICHSIHKFSLVTPETCSQRLSGLVSVANRFWFNVSPGGLLLHCVNWII